MNNGNMRPVTPNGHLHAEAYYLMTYEDSDGNVETIWNSRDGVTPFAMMSRQGKEARHVNFRQARYAPDHVPQVGDRIWANMTWERAKEYAAHRIARMKEHYGEAAIAEEYPSEEEFLIKEAEAIYNDGINPMLLEVTEEIQTIFKFRAERHGSMAKVFACKR